MAFLGSLVLCASQSKTLSGDWQTILRRRLLPFAVTPSTRLLVFYGSGLIQGRHSEMRNSTIVHCRQSRSDIQPSQQNTIQR
ncbi:uncharacterized protein EURHEDRAFT_203771 [Aspergillus ruber CBS 135680]|uniref:Uncharacterized protein n=1 Tax=Aspergillus ruber (strain CBS 135680) TaxID=1388766 RepID=A0A017S7G8_ASPRC|nr:uncharacterized protein EURHEDRAFT_203771 [Aspergillus ruber CBS 135680]EYE92090.1 hypothetical protein EURHEDRAFT_203771 [Aspergillus ruber CBS 135680]